MLSFGRDENAELTGCGFCADISLPHCDRCEEFRWKSRVIQRSSSPLPPVPRFERIQTVGSGPRVSSFWGSFSTSDRPRGRALLQQETQQPGSGGPRAASVERSHVACERSVVFLFYFFLT